MEVDQLRQHVYGAVETSSSTASPTVRQLDLCARDDRPEPGAPTTASNPSGPRDAFSPAAGYAVTSCLGQRGVMLGNNPAFQIPLGDPPTILTITSETGTVNVAITDADPPATWPGIINAATAAIGVTALITDATTLLDDGVTQVDPGGSGFLMFRTVGVGSDKTISVSTNKVFDGTGFTTTIASVSGVDMQGTIEGTPFSAVGLTITAAPGSNGADGLSFTFDSAPPVGAPAGTITVTVPPATVNDFTQRGADGAGSLDEHVVTSTRSARSWTSGYDPNTLTGDDLAKTRRRVAGYRCARRADPAREPGTERDRLPHGGAPRRADQRESTAPTPTSMKGDHRRRPGPAEATAMMQAAARAARRNSRCSSAPGAVQRGARVQHQHAGLLARSRRRTRSPRRNANRR